MISRISAKDAKRLRDPLRSTLPAPRPKYGNVKVRCEGETFDSKGELDHWLTLSLREARGEITDLKRQVRYVLCPPVRLHGEDRASSIKYIVDYQYRENGVLRLEDYKGMDTKISRLKRRLMKHVHGLDVHIVRAA